MGQREIAKFAPSAESEDVAAAVTRDGCAIVEGLVSKSTLDSIERELAPYVEATPKGDGEIMGFETKRTAGLMGKSPGAGLLACEPLILDIVDSILGAYCDRFQIMSTTTISIGPGETLQPLHRDDGLYPFRHPSQRECIVATLWALSDFTEENGATRMILDSHHWDDERQPTQEETIPVTMTRGSVSVYLGSVYHGGGANRSAGERTGLYIGYCLGWLRQEENQFLAVPPDVARTLPEQLQDLLGYSIHRPFWVGANIRTRETCLPRTIPSPVVGPTRSMRALTPWSRAPTCGGCRVHRGAPPHVLVCLPPRHHPVVHGHVQSGAGSRKRLSTLSVTFETLLS